MEHLNSLDSNIKANLTRSLFAKEKKKKSATQLEVLDEIKDQFGQRIQSAQDVYDHAKYKTGLTMLLSLPVPLTITVASNRYTLKLNQGMPFEQRRKRNKRMMGSNRGIKDYGLEIYES